MPHNKACVDCYNCNKCIKCTDCNNCDECVVCVNTVECDECISSNKCFFCLNCEDCNECDALLIVKYLPIAMNVAAVLSVIIVEIACFAIMLKTKMVLNICMAKIN